MAILSYAQTILFISDQFVLYCCIIMIILGLIGNLLNIMIFTGLKLFRGHPSVFYIVVGSTVDCVAVFTELLARIQHRAYLYDLTNISLFWCKVRAILYQLSTMISLTTLCFSSIDQYLSTNHRYDMRQMSNLKLAQRLTLINISCWMIHSIPFGIFYEIQSLIGCSIVNQGFKLYFSFVFLFILNGVLPLLISSVFSALSYRNVRHLVRRQIPVIRRKLDQQLTAMVLTRVLFLFIVSIPFGLQVIYTLNGSRDTNDLVRIAVEKLIIDITGTLYFFNFAGSFYLYWLSSTRFRRQMNYLFTKKIWRKFYRTICTGRTGRHNQVAPISHISPDN